MDKETQNKNLQTSGGGRRLTEEQSDIETRWARAATISVEEDQQETPRESRSERRAAKEHRGVRAERKPRSLPEKLRLLASRYMRHVKRRWNHILKERDRHNFPESDRLPIQLVLLFWGVLPVLASKLAEHTVGRRRLALMRSRGVQGGHHSRWKGLLIMTAGCAVAAVAVFTSIYTTGTTVIYDGEVIAVVESEEAVEEVCANLEAVTTRTLGETFTIDDSLIQYSSGLLKRDEIVDQKVLEEDLSEEIGLVTQAYCLYVDNEFIGATPYEGALEELLNQLQMAATDENTISCSFAEKVEIREAYMPTADMMNLGHLAEILYSTKMEEVTYEVKRGDTWLQIAADHGMTSKELQALNPGYDIHKLQIGEILTISASVPYLTMTVVQQERYVDDVPFEIEYTNSPDMYQGDYKVTSPGSYGSADVVANVTYVNGEEIQRTILSSVTLEEPITEHRVQGTKVRPTWYPTGTFRWPTTGRITSYFGGRKSPGGIGSTNHKGMDIAAPKGTPIYAADGGRVTYAGWMSGYGYTVRVDHLNGYTTFYAHNSKLLVSVGQTVHKGQQIAKMGSTGNSTGSHCHFEIRYNGVAKNPMSFLP